MAKSAPKHFFSQNPSVNQQRTLFDMSKTDTVTLNPDYYYPNYKLLVIPGDTVVLSYSNMIRLLDSLQVPMMDNLYCDTHWWFVAFDNVWDYTKQFFGEKKRPNEPDISSLPVINFAQNSLPQVGSVYDYFGIPCVGNDYKDNNNAWQPLLTGGFSINALPLLSYYLIHDDWIRDEQRDNYLISTSAMFQQLNYTPAQFDLYKRGKRFDYFTSTLLEPQVGDPVSVNIQAFSGTNTAYTTDINGKKFIPVVGTGRALVSPNTGVNTAQNLLPLSANFTNLGFRSDSFINNPCLTPFQFTSPAQIGNPTGSTAIYQSTRYVGLPTQSQYDNIQALNPTATGPNVLHYSLGVPLEGSMSISVESMRRAFQVQAYQEIMARYGTRYTEYIYAMYGVINPDQLLGRPEFLGSTHQRLSVQPIAQTSDTTNAPLGNLGAIVSGGISEGVFTRSFTRFGYIIGCINIYSDLTYYQGLEKDWSIVDRMDLPVNVFANLTDQPVYKKEICLTGTSSDDDVFGYNEIYAWAKYSQNSLRGLVRPNAPNGIGYWSLAQQFSSVPVNNSTFIKSDTPIDRITSVNTANNVHHFICNQKFDVKLTRELPMHSDPMKWMFRA